jgi:hypothetical protein
VLISPRQLLDRLRHPRSRADELSALRARFRAQPSRREASPERVAAAERLRALRIEMARATEAAAPASCSTCAKGHPLPHGHWSGGHCCGGRTLDVWTAAECASLKLAGTDASSLEPPPGDHAGCTFRGERGCSLAPEDRPSICLRYVCLDLRAELKRTGVWPEIARIAKAIETEQKLLDEA